MRLDRVLLVDVARGLGLIARAKQRAGPRGLAAAVISQLLGGGGQAVHAAEAASDSGGNENTHVRGGYACGGGNQAYGLAIAAVQIKHSDVFFGTGHAQDRLTQDLVLHRLLVKHPLQPAHLVLQRAILAGGSHLAAGASGGEGAACGVTASAPNS